MPTIGGLVPKPEVFRSPQPLSSAMGMDPGVNTRRTGGPSPARRATGRIIERGRADGTITQDVTPRDVVAFGAMLAQPRPPDPEWDATCRRLLATYLNGLRTC